MSKNLDMIPNMKKMILRTATKTNPSIIFVPTEIQKKVTFYA